MKNETRCQYNFIEWTEERAIVELLENIFKNRNQLIRSFKRVSPQLRNNSCQIKADKVPLGEHAGKFDASTVEKVSGIMVGDPIDKIKITLRDSTVVAISDNTVRTMHYNIR